MSAVELLPCPFCNEPPTVLKKGNELTRMSVTILCPKCRAERTDATPKAFNHANHDWLLAVATKNWNKRPIAPPVAAGSVDTAEFREVLNAAVMCKSSMQIQCNARLLDHIDAWGAQQREAGHREGYADGKGMADEIVAAIDKATQVRAEKAEAELKARDLFVDVLNCQVKKAESRVKELEAALTRIGPFNLTVD